MTLEFFRWRLRRPAAFSSKALRCSFCNKSERDVRKLIAGPTVFICDECVGVCNDILVDDAAKHSNRAHPSEPPVSPPFDSVRYLNCAVCRTPTSWDDAVLVPERGAICPGCIGEIEAAVARHRE